MKTFTFSLHTLLTMKKREFAKEAFELATLQKNVCNLEKRKEEMAETFEEMVEALIERPHLSLQIESMQERITQLEKEIALEKSKVVSYQKRVEISLNKKKVVEKIREARYALYQKELSRHNETD